MIGNLILGYLAGLVFIWWRVRGQPQSGIDLLATLLYPIALVIWAVYNARAAWYRAKDWIRDHI